MARTYVVTGSASGIGKATLELSQGRGHRVIGVDTPMVADYTATPESTAAILQRVPMPLNGIAQPRSVATLLAWLTSEENTHLCGQCVFIDGGSDAVLRGDSTW